MTLPVSDPGGSGLGRYLPVGVLLLAVGLTGWRLVVLRTNGLDLMFDEAQYWTWSRDFAFGYFSKPPMIAWVIRTATALCGDGEACVRAASPLLYLVTTGFVWALARKLYGSTVAWWSAAVFITLPGVFFSSLLISTDVPLLLFWSAALWLLAHALDLDDQGRVRGRVRGRVLGAWLALGLVLGLGMLSKYAMAYFVIGAAVFFAQSPQDRASLRGPGPWLALSIGLLLLVPNLVWNAAHGFVTLSHTAANANLGGTVLHPQRMAEFIGGQLAVFGPILFPILAWLLVRWRGPGRDAAQRDRRARFLLSFSAPVLALMIVQSLLSRAHANWAAVSYIAATVLVVAWLVRGRRFKLLGLSLALHMAAMTLLYHVDAILPAVAKVDWAGVERVKVDPFRRMRGWAALAERVDAVFAAHEDAVLLADERKHLAALLYYLRTRDPVAVKWNPGGAIHDHYDLTTDIASHADRRFIFVTRNFGAEHVRASFGTVTLIEDILIEPYPGLERRFEVYLLDGYRGAGEPES